MRRGRPTGGLADTQLGDGSWFNYYLGDQVKTRAHTNVWGDQVKDARLDTNVCAYVAAGLYHYLVATDDVDFCVELWPVVERAIDFVLRYPARRRDDRVVTRRDRSPRELRAVDRIVVDLPLAALRGRARRTRRRRQARPGNWRPDDSATPSRTTPAPSRRRTSSRWTGTTRSSRGALFGDAGLKRIDDGWERHVMDGYGVRCVSTSDWVTAAETAECVLALDALGLTARALDLFSYTRRHRREDGAYWTGIAYPE